MFFFLSLPNFQLNFQHPLSWNYDGIIAIISIDISIAMPIKFI